MGSTVYPTPAASAGETWTLISSVTPTNGSASVSFTSLSGYKKYWLVATDSVTISSSSDLCVRINGVTSSSYFNHYFYRNASTMSSYIDTVLYVGSGVGSSNIIFNIVIDNANQTYPKNISGGGGGSASGTLFHAGSYFPSASTVSSIQVLSAYPGDTSTFTGTGTIALYGVAA